MIHLATSVPRKINVAFSGGVDSLAVAHFLSKRHDVTLLHFNHRCPVSDQIELECRATAYWLGLPMKVGYLDERDNSDGSSIEDVWRRGRYRFLRSHGQFVTAHHLDDAVEWWIISSLHGEGKLIPMTDELVIRPFLTTPKSEFVDYCKNNGLSAVDDPENRNQSHIRNYVRSNIMEHALVVNPGLSKVIRKKYLALTKC